VATKVIWREVVEIEANTGDTKGEPFLERAMRDLSVWGGMSHSESVIDDDGNVSISFDPNTATGGRAAVLDWLESLDIEYEARFHRWWKD
jgi:hypothetical protein